MQECGTHLLTLINDLLDLTRLQAGKNTPHFSQIAVSEFISTIITEMKNFRPEAHISIQLLCVPEDVTVMADPQMLRQIIYNLLSNSIKFSPPNTKNPGSRRVSWKSFSNCVSASGTMESARR